MRIVIVFLVFVLGRGVFGQSSCSDPMNLSSACFGQFNFDDHSTTNATEYSDGACTYPWSTADDKGGHFRFKVNETFTSDVLVSNNRSQDVAFWVYEKSGNIDDVQCLSDPGLSLIACDYDNSGLASAGSITFTQNRDYVVYVEYYNISGPYPNISLNLSSGTSGDCGVGGTLPIELKHFTARAQNEVVRLDWASYTESNNERYVVERSIDGKNFEVIGEVPGAGNSVETLNYHLYDRSPALGINYYRLKQVDFDGKFEYFDIRSVEFNTIYGNLQLLGNPVTNELEYFINRENHGEVTVQLTDINGNIISTQKTALTQKQTYQTVDTSNLANGMYFLQLIVQGKVVDVEKVVIN